MFYDPRSQSHGLAHDPWLALVVPRPIGWISTVSAAGVPNLAPYSFFNAVSARPPFVMFASGKRKDTLTNAQETGVFAVNMAVASLSGEMNETSAELDPDMDEFAYAGLDMAPCQNIDCPHVADSPVVIECLLNHVHQLSPSSGRDCTTEIAYGEVVGIHIDDSVIRDGRVSLSGLAPIARLGYLDFAQLRDPFTMARPTSRVRDE
ncbi:flavin reductase family protein [Roseibium sp. Sym1]|uniref:flavin reductase family protein n=1 Tax=Roseibium sp. Sym1 TaxID=3016006 RepID=UPI0022B544C9|nr:flavin reductase family protein [Roseibium sp. Sym1]